MHIVGSVKHERPSQQQMAQWRNLPGVIHWGLRVVFAHDDMCLVVSDRLRGRSLHAMLKCEGPASLVKLFFTLFSFPCLLHSFRPYIQDTLGRARNVLHPGAFNVPSGIG